MTYYTIKGSQIWTLVHVCEYVILTNFFVYLRDVFYLEDFVNEEWVGVAAHVDVDCYSIIEKVNLVITNRSTLKRLERRVLLLAQLAIAY